ncbi:hypothetical protein HW932_01895 [Allochromatium humboldtianum]|uniref:Portal protein n=1 Tax=Allochromatium humboldtianum TaxID=504901 RepID=A0A850REC1_9GAMM|nr:portal protein [Allochromatium humboldtianum]NVZ08011.1 hypothetical protein [Allochromatium humboldtianum]
MKKTERDVARDAWDAYVRARDAGHEQWVKKAHEAERFYAGGGQQWDEADRQRLESEGKPVLEVNLILSTVNAMLGERINQRAEIRFQPMRGGTAQLAEAVLTPLVRHIQEDNQFHYLEGEMFQDGLITGRGYLDIRMNFDEDLRGEARISVVDPMTVIPDPYAKSYDTRDWREVITTRWMTLHEIEAEYGKEHRKKVEAFALTSDSLGAYEHDCIEWAIKDHSFGDPDAVVAERHSTEDISRVRVIERQFKQVAPARFYVDNATGDMREIPEDIPDERAAALAQQLGMSIIRRVRPRVRWTVTCGTHVIKDIWSPYPHFTIVGYFPYFMRGRPFGVVQNLISPQRQLNKAESQELHIINTTANSGWIIEAGSLLNMTEDELEARGAETGLVMVVRQGAQPPTKILPNHVPTGISNVASKASGAIKAISGIYDAMLGDAGREVSGKALEARIQRGTVQMQVPFDNLNRTRQIVGEMLYGLIREYYTEERVYHVADFNQPGAPIVPVEINKQQFDGTILNDVTIGEYAIRVSVGPSHDNVQEAQFQEALQLREAGVMIPDYAVVENSHLLHRHELSELLRKMQGFAEPTPEEQQMLQMQQQIQMEMVLAELATNKAKAMLLQAQAQQAQAKAQELEGGAQIQALELQSHIELELRKLEQRWAELQANLENKLQLAGVHAGIKSDLTRYTTVAKQTTEEMRQRTDLQKTAMQLQAAREKSTPPSKSKAR